MECRGSEETFSLKLSTPKKASKKSREHIEHNNSGGSYLLRQSSTLTVAGPFVAANQGINVAGGTSRIAMGLI